MRKIVTILLIGFMVLGMALVHAESVSSMLEATSWECGEASITFTSGGSGTYVNNNDKTFEMTWTLDGDIVSFEYSFYGKRTETFTVVEKEGSFQLINDKTNETFVPTGSAVPMELSAYPVELNEEVDLGFIKFHLSSAELAKGYNAPKGGRFLDAKKDSTYYLVTGKIQNTSKETIDVGNMLCEMNLDGYIYSAEILVLYNESLSSTLDPFCEGTLILAGAIPNALLEKTHSCQVTLSTAENLSKKPSSTESADFSFLFSFQDDSVQDRDLNREKVWCKESPALLMPESFVDLSSAGASSSSVNGKLSRCSYTYRPEFDVDDIQTLTETYYSALKEAGYSVSGSKTNFSVSYGGRKLAQVSIDTFDYLNLEIIPGNETYKTRPQEGVPAPVVTEVPMQRIGNTIKTDKLQLSLEKTGTASILYSSIQEKNGIYHYYEPEQGEQFYYLFGSFTNNAGLPLDMRHIYAEFIIDDTQHYPGDSIGVHSGASDFIIDLNSGNTCNYYIFASIPKNVLSKAKSIVIKIGFTSDFGLQYSDVNGLPLFTHCEDVFEIKAK